MNPIYKGREFQEACEDIDGDFERKVNGEDEMFICDKDNRSIVWHNYAEPRNENNVFVWSNTDAPPEDHENEWSGNARNLYESDEGIVLEDAEGNPEPGIGQPMYVGDATVTFGTYDTRAEQTRTF